MKKLDPELHREVQRVRRQQFDARDLLGRRLADARSVGASHGCEVVVGRGGAVADVGRSDRVIVKVYDDKVVAVDVS